MNNWTGERLETFVYNSVTAEHLHRYGLALELARGKNVLDIACGEGYGSNLLSDCARNVTGVDIDSDTITTARGKYQKANLSFLIGSAADIPLPDGSVDIVISFETLEHHPYHVEMFKEVKRVLVKDGLFFISTPDKKNYSDIPAYTNSFHVKELYRSEFCELAGSFFTNYEVFDQKYLTGSLITGPSDQRMPFRFYQGDYNAVNTHEFADLAVYNICLASDASLPILCNSFFDASAFQAEWYDRNFKDLKDTYEQSFCFKVGKAITAPLRAAGRLFNKKPGV
jgi:ubiquinone/menaquinone biosynthesis C-methylase UbiE